MSWILKLRIGKQMQILATAQGVANKLNHCVQHDVETDKLYNNSNLIALRWLVQYSAVYFDALFFLA
jgi:hypothetical protein